MTPIDFEITWSKVKVKLLVVRSIFLYPFDGKLPNLIQWMPLEMRCSGHMVKGQMADVRKKCLLNI